MPDEALPVSLLRRRLPDHHQALQAGADTTGGNLAAADAGARARRQGPQHNTGWSGSRCVFVHMGLSRHAGVSSAGCCDRLLLHNHQSRERSHTRISLRLRCVGHAGLTAIAATLINYHQLCAHPPSCPYRLLVLLHPCTPPLSSTPPLQPPHQTHPHPRSVCP